jgi:hypothetical protein
MGEMTAEGIIDIIGAFSGGSYIWRKSILSV